MSRGAKPLENPRHEAFAQYYVFGHPEAAENGPAGRHWSVKVRKNATKSYEAAGYDARGQSATVAARRLLKRRDVQRRIEELEAMRRPNGGEERW